MDPKYVQLAAAVIAIAASIASAFVPDTATAEGLRHISALVLGWAFIRRPGDVSLVAHPDDVGGQS